MKWLNPCQIRSGKLRWIGLFVALHWLAPQSQARASDTSLVRLTRQGQADSEGKFEGSLAVGFRFVSGATQTLTPLRAGDALEFASEAPEPLASAPPFRVLLGECMRLSGSLLSLDDKSVQIKIPGMQRELLISRGAVQAVEQIPGETRLFTEGFESLDGSCWLPSGIAKLDETKPLAGKKSLRVDAGDPTLSHALSSPIFAGRVDIAFHDSAKVARGQLCGIEFAFRGQGEVSRLRVDLGWNDESLTVESPVGPALVVQRLARTPGWHRLSLEFRSGSIAISVDGQELANGKGPNGPLFSIRVGTSRSPIPKESKKEKESDEAAAPPSIAPFYFDELSVTRFSEPPTSLEIDPTQDEARLVSGDQFFGSINRADSVRVGATVADKRLDLPWGDVSGLHFKRIPTRGEPVEGLFVRAEWSNTHRTDVNSFDFAEGSLQSISRTTIALKTPFAGTLEIPLTRMRSLRILSEGRRIVLDVSSHHLGESISIQPPLLDPPVAEGTSLERTIKLDSAIEGPSVLALDVVQVVGESPGLPFSDLIRKGELRTYVVIDGKRIDYLNRHITTLNETVERIRIPIAPGTFGAGTHTIRIEQTATAEDPNGFDDLGIVQMAIETGSPAGKPPATEKP